MSIESTISLQHFSLDYLTYLYYSFNCLTPENITFEYFSNILYETLVKCTNFDLLYTESSNYKFVKQSLLQLHVHSPTLLDLLVNEKILSSDLFLTSKGLEIMEDFDKTKNK